MPLLNTACKVETATDVTFNTEQAQVSLARSCLLSCGEPHVSPDVGQSDSLQLCVGPGLGSNSAAAHPLLLSFVCGGLARESTRVEEHSI